jgi:Holliday junction resolvase YEN1
MHKSRSFDVKNTARSFLKKQIWYRVTGLLALNIRPIFILDGPKRPCKCSRRGENEVDYEITRLLNEMLTKLDVPFHHAPGEAEVECARLCALGVVDAVCSDDGDTFMFGDNVLIKSVYESKGKGKTKKGGGAAKSKEIVRIYDADEIRNGEKRED